MRRLICSAEYRLGQNGLSDFQVLFCFSFSSSRTLIYFVLFRIIPGLLVSTGTTFVIVQHLTYQKSVVQQTHPTLMSMTRTSEAPTSFRPQPIPFLAPSTFLFSVSPTLRAGMCRQFRFFFFLILPPPLIVFFHFHFFSLLTDMNRLLIHSNGTGDGYTPALTHSVTTASAVNGSSGESSNGGPSSNNNDVRRLQDEVNQLTKRNGGTFSFFFPPPIPKRRRPRSNNSIFLFRRADAAVGESGTARKGDVGVDEERL